MKISKVSDRGVTNESDMLFSILKDIYYQQDPLFEDMKMLSKPNIEKTGQVKMTSADVRPYHKLFKLLSEKSV